MVIDGIIVDLYNYLINKIIGGLIAVALKLDMPEGALAAMKKNPTEFAAEIAGLTRADFIVSLDRFHVFPFQYSADETEEDLRYAD